MRTSRPVLLALVAASCVVVVGGLVIGLGIRGRGRARDAASPATSPTPTAATRGPTGEPGRAELSSGLDFGRVIRQVHFAYRAEGGAFAGGHKNYSSRVEAGGQIEFQPIDPGPQAGKGAAG